MRRRTAWVTLTLANTATCVWLGALWARSWSWAHGHPDAAQTGAGAVIGGIAGLLVALLVATLVDRTLREGRRADTILAAERAHVGRHRDPETLDLAGVLVVVRRLNQPIDGVMGLADEAGVRAERVS